MTSIISFNLLKITQIQPFLFKFKPYISYIILFHAYFYLAHIISSDSLCAGIELLRGVFSDFVHDPNILCLSDLHAIIDQDLVGTCL